MYLLNDSLAIDEDVHHPVIHLFVTVVSLLLGRENVNVQLELSAS